MRFYWENQEVSGDRGVKEKEMSSHFEIDVLVLKNHSGFYGLLEVFLDNDKSLRYCTMDWRDNSTP